MAISCEFGMLSYAHEILIYCGEQIDPVSESRYAQLFRKFSDFDLANRQPPKRPNRSNRSNRTKPKRFRKGCVSLDRMRSAKIQIIQNYGACFFAMSLMKA